MKYTSSANKTTRATARVSETNASAGLNGIAIAPPTYGMDMVEDQPIQTALEHEPDYYSQESTTWPARDGAIQRKVASPNAGNSAPRMYQENRTGLPDNLKAGIERLSGLAMDDVRVHYNSAKPAQLQALAYTQGTQIHVGPGQERHLPHEAWHVVQQKQGRVEPTLQAKGVALNDDKGLEHEADLMGMKALQFGRFEHHAIGTAAQLVTAVQRVEATSLSPRSPTGREVVQLASTTLRFETAITGNSKITATQHNRSAVHQSAVNWVFDNGAWKSVPDGTVCNHSKDYNQMAQRILNAIHDETLSDAANTVTTTYTTLEGENQGLGAPTSTHKNRMERLVNHPSYDANVDNVVDSFNYYIYKICDYPRNLFFWPDKTDSDPDEPNGEYGTNGDWQVTNSLISNKLRLSREKKRLSDARGDLVGALP